MAFVVKQHGKWCVDFTGLDGHRQRHIVGGGLDRGAAQVQAELITAELRGRRQARNLPNVASVDSVVTSWLADRRPLVSRRTFTRYEGYARGWQQFWSAREIRHFCLIDAPVISAYRNAQLTHLSNKTVHNDLTAMGSLFIWAEKQGYCHGNPLKGLRKPKLPAALPYAFTPQQQAALLQASYENPQLYLILCLGIYAGLRRAGVLQLRVDDVDLGSMPETIRVREKGEKERVIPVHPALKVAFQRCPPVNCEFWFGNATQKQSMFFGDVCAFIRRVTGQTGLRARFHNCRHCFATNLLREGVSLRVVQELMGHADISTTAIYASVIDADKVNAIARLPSMTGEIRCNSDGRREDLATLRQVELRPGVTTLSRDSHTAMRHS
jgi:integrase/recombinase XerD